MPESVQLSSVQSQNCVQVFASPWTAAHQASLSITNSRSLPKFLSIELVMPSNHLILCHPLLLLPPIPPSIRIFSNDSTLRNTTGMPWSSTKPPAAAIQPAWRPITSSTNTLVEVLAIERTSKLASSVDTAMYLATEPKPGQQSVIGRSLSTVFGTWMAWIG